jgi:glycosyltransferase involved in cell wall biosynthesis
LKKINTIDHVKQKKREMPQDVTEITLHLLAVPHAITSPDFSSSCAFNGKVLRFSPMIHHQPGFKVIHYGIESSQSGADEEVQVLSLEEWNHLRVQSMIKKDPQLDEEAAKARLADDKNFVGDLADSSNVLYRTFNSKAKQLLCERIDGVPGMHIVCLPFGLGHAQAIEHTDWTCVESGIGYPTSFLNYRIFESDEWLHANQGKESGQNYWFVCPNYYDVSEWDFCENPKLDEVHYLGRLQECKGLYELLACAERMPDVTFVICGPGDPKPFLSSNVVYKPPVHGRERSEYLGNCACVLTPTKFIEPFCGVSAEAQLCGTPVMAKSYGAFNTNIEQFATGVKAHTLQDLVEGIRAAQRGEFDRRYIRERAKRLWGYEAVARQYAYAFRTIADVHNGRQGWYSPVSHLNVFEGSIVQEA